MMIYHDKNGTQTLSLLLFSKLDFGGGGVCEATELWLEDTFYLQPLRDTDENGQQVNRMGCCPLLPSSLLSSQEQHSLLQSRL